ncbi:hypothetical protein [Alteribacillus sp. YIM 98480]|uniref:hypothetical protein n=1 Tax=Alteribacillus sp. YIM 98480 TaxID=2606599 RepID=UPI00131BE591|nr:hypothetical protein [Alteribacillus sp. YIM 98480]
MSKRSCSCSDLLTGINLNDFVVVTVKCELEGENAEIQGFITRMTPVIQLDVISGVINICCDSVCAVRRLSPNNVEAGSTELKGFMGKLPSNIVEEIRSKRGNRSK